MISKELILEGTKFRKTVHLTTYDEDIEIKPLSELEIAKVFKTVETLGSRLPIRSCPTTTFCNWKHVATVLLIQPYMNV